MTAHIVDDNPVAQIRGYKFQENGLWGLKDIDGSVVNRLDELNFYKKQT